MTGEQIIQKFYDWVDDEDIGDEAALDLAQEVYDDILDDRNWWFLKKVSSGLVTSLSLPYIALPDDYREFATFDEEGRPYVRSGDNYVPFHEIAFSEARDYRTDPYAFYFDDANNRIVFPYQPTQVMAMEFDYIFNPPLLTLDTGTVLPRGSEWVIPHGMAAKFPLRDHQEKGRSYRNEHQEEYGRILANLQQKDAKFKVAEMERRRAHRRF